MTSTLFLNCMGLMPEILLGVAILLLLILTVFMPQTSKTSHQLNTVALAFLAAISIFMTVLLFQDARPSYVFDGLFMKDAFSHFIKCFMSIAALCIFSFSRPVLFHEKLDRPEYGILTLMILLGVFLMVDSNDFMSLYLGLELQSLGLYVLVAFRRDSVFSTEAAFKYFILGSLASGLYLFGASLLYGVVGSLNFQDTAFVLTALLKPESHLPIMILGGGFLGVLMIMVGLLFKVSAAPFHMWAPDVYEGAPFSVTAFLALVPKVAGIAVLLRVAVEPFSAFIETNAENTSFLFPQLLMGVALLSTLIGAFGGLMQLNVKRLLAYSSISHMGYILLGIFCGGQEGIEAAIFYTLLYIVMGIGFFATLSCLRYPVGHPKVGLVEDLFDLKGLAKAHPKYALTLTIFLFSLAGIPPFAGFFGKLYVFLSVIQHAHTFIAILAILASVVSAFYYLRIIKYMYFDEPEATLETEAPLTVRILLVLSTVVVMLFFVYPDPFLWASKFASFYLLR